MALHREIWRRIPRFIRRPVGRMLLNARAPSITPGARFDRTKPWIVVGFLSSPSGLGQAARLAFTGLQREGFDVYGVDLSHAFYEAAGAIDFAFRDGRAIDGAANVLININAPYMRYALALLGARFVRGKAILGYWVWELERAPPDWVAGFACVHAIAAPSQFAARAIEAIGDRRRVFVLPHPVMLGRLPPAATTSNAAFEIVSVLSAASGFERKNPIALVRAFKLAFAGDETKRLRLRVTHPDLYPRGMAALRDAIGDARNISLSSERMSEAEFLQWWGVPQLYASLHRAEGFGLPLAEAMAAGVPVVATNWSANAEYMDSSNSFPVPARLVTVDDPQGKYASGEGQWAEVDIEAAAAALRDAAANRDVLRSKAAAARAAAERLFSRVDVSALFEESPLP